MASKCMRTKSKTLLILHLSFPGYPANHTRSSNGYLSMTPRTLSNRDRARRQDLSWTRVRAALSSKILQASGPRRSQGADLLEEFRRLFQRGAVERLALHELKFVLCVWMIA